jgi:anti-sigma B factor antagonist
MSFSIKKQGDIVVVDVEGQLIVGNRQELKQKVLDERLANLNDDLKTLFELTKLDTLFQIADTRERALESF